MTTQNGRAFNEWLRAQLKAKKMSQRQLAQQSGVDHSTISRLIRGDRMPSLGTATKLARGLRELRDDADMPSYLGVVSSGAANPLARVEYALRSDDYLSEAQVRQVMEYYIAVRTRRFGGGRPGSGDYTTRNGTSDPSRTSDARRPTAGNPSGQRRADSRRATRPSGPSAGRGAVRAATDTAPWGTTRRPSTSGSRGSANAGIWGAGVRACPGNRVAASCSGTRLIWEPESTNLMSR